MTLIKIEETKSIFFQSFKNLKDNVRLDRLAIPSLVSKYLWTHLCIHKINKTKLQGTVDVASVNRLILEIK